jgi:hypothetical protein
MEPVSPVIPGYEKEEVVVAKDQKEYGNLPVLHIGEGILLSRWELTEKDLAKVTETKSIYFYQWTFGQPVQPVAMQVEPGLGDYSDENIKREALQIDGQKEEREGS